MSYHVQAASGLLVTAETIDDAERTAMLISNGLVNSDVDIMSCVVIVQDTQAPYGVAAIYDSGMRMDW